MFTSPYQKLEHMFGFVKVMHKTMLFLFLRHGVVMLFVRVISNTVCGLTDITNTCKLNKIK